MKEPLVSCLIGTMAGRKPLLKQFIKYFDRQTWPNKELVIVDDDPDAEEFEIPERPDLTYIPIQYPALIPDKYNRAVEVARGDILIKMDDDDWYHPGIVAAAAAAVVEGGERALARIGGFPILFLEPWDLRFDPEWRAGNLICFHRSLWEKKPFRDEPKMGFDVVFYNDHEYEETVLPGEKFTVVIRHNMNHDWVDWDGRPIEDFFRKERPTYPLPIEDLIPAEDVLFYRSLRDQIIGSRIR